MSDIEDEIEARRQAMSFLEDDTEELVGDRRRAGIKDRYDGDEAIITHDALEEAEQLAHRYGPSSTLSHKVAVRNKQWQEQDERAPYVRTNPASVLQGTLGGQQLITVSGINVLEGEPPGNVSRLIQVCNWGGDDAETIPITVTAAPVQQIVNFPAGTFILAPKPFAVVQFGTRGFLVKAEVDIGTGTQFTVSGSSITVQVGFEWDFGIVVPPGTEVAAQMKLAGMLSFRAIERTAPLTRTKYGITGNSVPAIFPVPPFAKRFTVWRPDPTIPQVVTMRNDLGVSYLVNLPANDNGTEITLATDITEVRVTQGPASAGTISVIFELEI